MMQNKPQLAAKNAKTREGKKWIRCRKKEERRKAEDKKRRREEDKKKLVGKSRSFA